MLGLFKKNKVSMKTPTEGKVIDITAVPDHVFSQKMLGEGFAVEPTSGIIKAPCDGELVQVFPTNHAFGIKTEEGLEILVHIGIDTVELKGEGFKRLVEPGVTVSAGTPIIEVDLDFIQSKGKPSVTPVVITTPDKIKNVKVFDSVKKDGTALEAELV